MIGWQKPEGSNQSKDAQSSKLFLKMKYKCHSLVIVVYLPPLFSSLHFQWEENVFNFFFRAQMIYNVLSSWRKYFFPCQCYPQNIAFPSYKNNLENTEKHKYLSSSFLFLYTHTVLGITLNILFFVGFNFFAVLNPWACTC